MQRQKIMAGIFVALVVVLTGVGINHRAVVQPLPSPLLHKLIVLDAGHGGQDGGCVGQKGTKESDVNLAITLKLGRMLQQSGCQVVYTRSGQEGLFVDGQPWTKRTDMQVRGTIIRDTPCDAVVSIHMNAFPGKGESGPQIMTQCGTKVYSPSYILAEEMHNTLKEWVLPQTRRVVKEADLFILRQSDVPSVLVECGFLTNAKEEIKLLNEDYQEKLAHAMLTALSDFFAKAIDDQGMVIPCPTLTP